MGTWIDNEDVINGHFESCMLPENRPTVDAEEQEEQAEPTKQTDVGHELNNSLKRLSVQEKTDADDEKSVAEI